MGSQIDDDSLEHADFQKILTSKFKNTKKSVSPSSIKD